MISEYSNYALYTNQLYCGIGEERDQIAVAPRTPVPDPRGELARR